MTLKKFFDITGNNYNETVSRFSDENLALKFIKRFPGDPSFSEFEESLKTDDLAKAFKSAHKFKGVCWNVGLDTLGDKAAEIDEYLRVPAKEPKYDLPKNEKLDIAKKMFPDLKHDYEVTVSAITEIE